MNKIAIQAKTDFLERLSSASPIKAITELIWNGLDAGAHLVEIILEFNDLDGLKKIIVKDTGEGISHSDIQILFGNLGESWKKQKQRLQKGS